MVRLNVLGGLGLEIDGEPAQGPATQRQRLLLLAFLAASDGPVSRDQLLSVLWPTGDSAKSRHALSNALYGLRSSLPEEAVTARGESLELNRVVVSCDLVDFREALKNHDLTGAVEAYGGPFLEGIGAGDVEFERWSEDLRAQVNQQILSCYEGLATGADGIGDWGEAVRWWRAFATLDPWSTKGALAFMRSLAEVGDRAAAIRHATVHTALLRQELDLDPDPQVLALAEELRTAPTAGPHAEKREEETRTEDRLEPAPAESQDRSQDGPKESHDGPDKRTPDSQPPVSRFALKAALALVLVAVVAVILLQSLGRTSAEAPSDTSPPRGLAVLPLENLSPDPDDEFFSVAMTEVLTAELSRLDSLTVVSRTSATALVGQGLTAPEIADRLGVPAIVEGSVFRSGGQVRVTVQLIDARSDEHLWAESYVSETNDPIALQRRVAQAIANALSLTLSPIEAERLASSPTEVNEAQEAFLRGLAHSRRFNRESVGDAIADYESAIELDPEYADAAGMLAVSYWLLSQPLSGIAPHVGMPQAREWALRAVELDSLSADGWATLGWVSLFYERNVIEAQRYFDQAIAVRPAFSVGYNGLSFSHLVSGEADEAVATGRIAAGGIPLDLSFRTALAEVLYYLRRFDEALLELEAVENADRNFERLYHVRRWVYEVRGQYAEALGAYQETLRLNPTWTGPPPPEEEALSAEDYWQWRVEVLREARASGQGILVIEGAANLQLGDADAALDLLEQALDEGEGSVILIDVDPAWDPARSDPRFQSLVERAKTPRSD